jgi:proline iminopeptidase
VDRRGFYPEIEPYHTGRLRVSELHELYFEEVGSPDGKPAVFLHGGPGAGLIPLYRQAFDPRAYRVVLFDQRGCGRSAPLGELRENTTWDLVADIEALRVHLGIERWQVFGGSWGSTLALAYAETHPNRVTELVLRGVCLWRSEEFDWMYRSGASAIHPEAWEEFVALIPEAERDDLVAAYHRRLGSDDALLRRRAAVAWGRWESCKIALVPTPEYQGDMSDDYAQTIALFECHYIVNRAWLERDAQLLQDVQRIRHIPTVIVQGRYDTITPVSTAWDLKRAFPEASLRIVPVAGHAFFEPDIAHELVTATDAFAARKG